MSEFKKFELKNGNTTFECIDKFDEVLDEYILAVDAGFRWAFDMSLDGITLSAKKLMMGYNAIDLVELIDKMLKEVEDGADPHNLFMTCAYLHCLKSSNNQNMSYEHTLGYIPPAKEDIIVDGKILRPKGVAKLPFLHKDVAYYINKQKQKPLRAIVVSTDTMNDLLKTYGCYGGEFNYGTGFMAKFPSNIQITPKLKQDNGDDTLAIWEYTTASHFYFTCKQ